MPTNHDQMEAHVPSREELCEHALSWTYYLEELAFYARSGGVVGSLMPTFPLSAVLAGLHDAV